MAKDNSGKYKKQSDLITELIKKSRELGLSEEAQLEVEQQI